MTVSSKKLLLALALFAPDEVAAFAIPSLGRSAPVAASCQRTASVAHGDDCAVLASKCNISNDALITLNPDDNFCSTLRTGKLICCSRGIQPRSPAGTEEGDDSQESNEEPQDTDGNDQNSTDDGQDSGDDGQSSSGDDQDADGNDDSSGSEGTPTETDDEKGDGDDDEGKDNDKKGDGNKGKDDGALEDDSIRGPRTGNWTKIPCTDPAAKTITKLSPQERWTRLGAAAAFQDAVDYFKKVDRPQNSATLPSSIIATLMGPNPFACQNMGDQSCAAIAVCPQYNQEGTGPAAMLIQNSFANIRSVRLAHTTRITHTQRSHTKLTMIRQLYTRTDFALSKANSFFQPSMDSFIAAFAPVPPPPKEDNQWLDFFIDITTMGAAAGLGRMVKAGKASRVVCSGYPSNANEMHTGIKEFATLAKAADHNDVKAAAESLLGGAVDKMKNLHEDKKSL